MIKKIIVSVIVIAAIGGLIYFALKNIENAGERSGIPKNAYPAEITYSGSDTITDKISAHGVVEIVDKITLYPKTDAKVINLNIKAGDFINEGDILFEYSDEALISYRNQIDDLKYQLQAARLKVADIKIIEPDEMDLLAASRLIESANNDIADLKRRMETADKAVALLMDELCKSEEKRDNAGLLYDAGLMPRLEYETFNDAVAKIENEINTRQTERDALDPAMEILEGNLSYNEKRYDALLNSNTNEESVQAQINQGNISISQIELKITQIQKQIDDFINTEITPVSGSVLTLNIKEGGIASRGQPFAEIADMGYENLRITLNVPEAEAALIRLGQKAEITGNILGKRTVFGAVSKIMPIAEQKNISGSLETVIGIELSFDDESGMLRLGNTVDADITVNTHEDITIVPLMATFSDTDGKEYVYIVNDDYTVSKREIEIITFSDLNVGVAGLDTGLKIVASPTDMITDGSYIKPVIRGE